MPIAHLSQIAVIAADKELENLQFRDFLNTTDSAVIDAFVFELNAAIEPQINCTDCGNCCKTLMINVTETEADRLANHLQQTRLEFDEKFLEKGSNGMMLINTIPCHFLAENKCTVYEQRFAGCKEFPGLNVPDFTKRLFTVFMHYSRCPIIFNVVEALKISTGFSPA